MGVRLRAKPQWAWHTLTHEDSTPLSRPRHYNQSLRVVHWAPEPKLVPLLTAPMVIPHLLLLGFASIFAWGWQPALTFQPTIVGVLWAGVFLAGYVLGGMGHGQVGAIILAAPVAYFSWLAFVSLTDIGAADSLLLATALLVGGWGASQCKSLRDCVGYVGRGQDLSPPRWRWSIWDIAFVTTMVACVVHAVPRLETPPLLMFSVGAALFSGLLCSWIACSWAWKDDWNWWSLTALAATLVVGTAIVYFSAPSGLSLVHAIKWGIAGPVNVIAAQGTAVLAVLSIWRWARDRVVIG